MRIKSKIIKYTFSGLALSFLLYVNANALDIQISCPNIDDISLCEQILPEENISAFENVLQLANDIDQCKESEGGIECSSSVTGEKLICGIDGNTASCTLPDGASAVCIETSTNDVEGAECTVSLPEAGSVNNNINALQTSVQSSFSTVVSQVCTARGADAHLQRDCSTLLNLINSGNSEVASEILNQINPTYAAIASNIGLYNQASQSRNIQDRLDQRRKKNSEEETPASKLNNATQLNNDPFETLNLQTKSTVKGILLAFNTLSHQLAQNETQTDTSQVRSTERAADSKLEPIYGNERTGTFFSGIFTTTEKDLSSLELGADTDLTGFTAGVDHRFTDRLLMGIAFGLNQSDTSFSNNRGEIETTNISITYFGTYSFDQNIYLDTTLSYGGSDYSQTRKIQYTAGGPPVDQNASADFFGSQTLLSITTGWDWNRDALTLNPYLQWQKIDVRIDDYAESMSNPNSAGSGWAIALNSQWLKSSTLRFGTQANWSISKPWGVLIPTARIELVKEFEDDPRLISGSFAGDRIDQNQFQLAADALDSSYLYYGVGISTLHTHGISGFIFLKSLSGYENLNQTEISLGARLPF